MLDLQAIMGMSQEELEEWMRKNKDSMAGMDHASLYQMRERLGRNSSMQGDISPYEHRAFAREATKDNPLMGLPIAAATPLYQLYKMATSQSRSRPSIDQITQGWTGVGEGIRDRFRS